MTVICPDVFICDLLVVLYVLKGGKCQVRVWLVFYLATMIKTQLVDTQAA